MLHEKLSLATSAAKGQCDKNRQQPVKATNLSEQNGRNRNESRIVNARFRIVNAKFMIWISFVVVVGCMFNAIVSLQRLSQMWCLLCNSNTYHRVPPLSWSPAVQWLDLIWSRSDSERTADLILAMPALNAASQPGSWAHTHTQRTNEWMNECLPRR